MAQVVARVLISGIERRISVRILRVVLLLEAGNRRLCAHHALLRVHAGDSPHFLLAHRQQRFLRVLLVRIVKHQPHWVGLLNAQVVVTYKRIPKNFSAGYRTANAHERR